MAVKMLGRSRLKTSRLIVILVQIILFLTTFNLIRTYQTSIWWPTIPFQLAPIKKSVEEHSWPFYKWEEVCDIVDLLPSLRSYCQWHFEQKKCFLDHSCKFGNPKLLIWQCPFNKHSRCGGLGDRLRGIQFSLFLAIVMKRLFLVDWPDGPLSMETGIIPASIDWRMTKIDDGEQIPVIEHQRLPYIQWSKCPQQYICQLNATKYSDRIRTEQRIIPSRVRIENGDIESFLGNFEKLVIVARADLRSVEYLSRNEKALKDFEDVRPGNIDAFSLSRQLLQLTFQPSLPVKHELRKHYNLMPQQQYISIHVRTGYDFGEMVASRFEGLHQSRSDLALRFVHCAMGLLHGNRSQVFLASDSKIFKNDFLLVSKQLNLSVYFSSLPSFHIGLPHRISSNSSADDRRMAQINTFVDFFAVAYSTIIISNGSGFSRLAHIIGNASRYIEVNNSEDVGKCNMTNVSD